MMNTQKNKTKYWLLAIIVIILDQISKTIILKNFVFAERLNIIPHIFDLVLVYNKGAAFSFLAQAGGWQKLFFVVLAIVICLYLVYAIVKDQFACLGKIGAAMVIGGAIGNVIDRIIHGHVIDFILFYWQDWYYPAFNIADSFICIGAVLLIIDGLKNKKAKSVNK